MKTITESIVDSLHEYFVVYPSLPKLNTIETKWTVLGNLFDMYIIEEFIQYTQKHRFAQHVNVPKMVCFKPWNKELAERVKQIKHNHRRK